MMKWTDLDDLLGVDLRDLDLLDAELVGLHLSELDLRDPWAVGCLLGGAAEDAIASGNRDENALTDLAFYERHPERKLFQDPKIQKGEKDAIKEWLRIREDVVRPALSKTAPAAAPRVPGLWQPAAASAPAAPPPGSNAELAEQQQAVTKWNQIIATALGLLAAIGLVAGVATAARS